MKYRKIVALMMMCVMMAFSMVGCSEEKIPEGFTEEEYKQSQKVLDIIEQYLNADITGEDAVKKLDVLSEQLGMSDEPAVSHIGSQAGFASYHIDRIVKGYYYTDSEDIKEIKEIKQEIVDSLKME